MPNWTKEQNEAINKTGTNIIVSAGAGSGKTAVLTERVITKLKSKIHINELLILTFTNNAAAEMKSRIKEAILENENIKNEANLVESAYITTFDAYVLSLVKKYHYLLNLSSKINIIDSSIINKTKKEYLNDIFNEYYKNKDQNFIELVTNYGIKNDKNLKKAILILDNKIDLLTNKEEYLNNYIDKYYTSNNIENLFTKYTTILLESINTIKQLLENLSYEVPENFYENYYSALEPLLNSKTYNEIKTNLNIGTFRLVGATEEGKYYKSEITKIIKNLEISTFYNENILKEELLKTKEHATIIINILIKLNNKIKDFKLKYEMFEFNDISKFAIKLLKNNDDIRENIKNSFKEIMIDEYQDTSDVQEEFVNLIENNNVYMVGDIKQSIYRFRNANPDIFKIKYDAYKNHQNGIKIDLNKNFRSREEVLSSINEIFIHIMDDKIGNANYKKEHQLIFGNPIFTGNGDNHYNNKISILNYEYDKTFTKEETEAFIIGNDILNKIKNKYQVLDKQGLRDCTYKDFCILMDRTTSFDIYKQVFDYLMIPLNIYKDDNILKTEETLIINNIINLIINIKKNIYTNETYLYFASIARSYLFNLKDNEIYQIIQNKKLKETKIYEKCHNILKDIDSMSNKEFINRIIEDFEFYEKMTTTSNINNKTIIINNLISKIDELNKVGINIYGINEYLNSLIEDNEALKISSIITDSDSVTITNIHKSKGLEYKICYYSGLYKEFNFDELKSKILFTNNYGLIIPYITNKIKPTFVSSIYKEKFIKDEISEKIRLFYVALTRCKEKMIIVTSLNPEKYIIKTNEEIIDYLTRIKYKSFNDFLNSIYPFIEKYITNINIPTINQNYKISKKIDITALKKITPQITVKEIEKTNEIINETHYSKVSNDLITKEEKDNMLYGTRLHYILEITDFLNPDYKDLSPYEKEVISSLLNHDILKNIKNAQIYKEYEFIYENNFEEKHGIIDLLLCYENHNDIIDYKLKNTADKNYIKQLNGYKEYIEKITNKPTNIYLYSLLNKELIKLN